MGPPERAAHGTKGGRKSPTSRNRVMMKRNKLSEDPRGGNAFFVLLFESNQVWFTDFMNAFERTDVIFKCRADPPLCIPGADLVSLAANERVRYDF